MVMLGRGGKEQSERHASDTAELLNRIQPRFVGVLTTHLEEGTPLFDLVESGEFSLPSRYGMVKELRHLISKLELDNSLLTSAHASNYLTIRSVLPKDKRKTLAYIDSIMSKADENLLKPEFMRGL